MPQTVSQLPRSILGGAQVTKSVFIPLATIATTGSVEYTVPAPAAGGAQYGGAGLFYGAPASCFLGGVPAGGGLFFARVVSRWACGPPPPQRLSTAAWARIPRRALL